MLVIWEARRLDRVLTSGRTKPVVLECVLPGSSLVGQNEATRLMVVKALGPGKVTETSLVCELFGGLLAQELGILTPECAVVNISPQMAEALRPRLHPNSFEPGFGVGSEFMRAGMATVMADMTLLPEELQQASRLYAFDLLVQNPDRRKDNPNCAFTGKDIYAYDYEMCFSFLQLLFSIGQAWEVSRHGVAEDHIFRGALNNKVINWKPFVERVSRLTEGTLTELVSRLPSSWQEKTAKIQAHLLSAAAHPKELEMELERSIA